MNYRLLINTKPYREEMLKNECPVAVTDDTIRDLFAAGRDLVKKLNLKKLEIIVEK